MGRGDESDEREEVAPAAVLAEAEPVEVLASYRVPEENIPRLRTDLERLSKKAVKLGFPPMTVEVKGYDDQIAPDGSVRSVVLLDVFGAVAALSGWTFYGTLTPLENEVLVRSVAGRQIPDKYRSADPTWCEHCKLRRARNHTLVIVNQAGESTQVGSSCLRDFFGGLDPNEVAAYAELLARAEDMGRSSEHYAGSPTPPTRFLIGEFLAQAVAVSKARGFVSRGAARANPGILYATADEAWQALHAVRPVSDEDRQTATDLFEWGIAHFAGRPLNDYEHNMSVVLALPTVEYKSIGLAASLIAAQEYTARKAALASARMAAAASGTPTYVSVHVGQVGVRQIFALTVTEGKLLPERYPGQPPTYLYRFRDALGNVFTYFSSRALQVEIGDSCNLKATVKAHDKYQGINQTVLTRGVLAP